MEEKNLSSWEEFKIELDNLLETTNQQKKDNKPIHVSDLLFRGQSDSSWKLSTTLERFTNEEISINKYYRLAHAAKPQIETFTKRSWQLSTPPEYAEKFIKNEYDPFFIKDMSFYQYQIYLRHHGFPSPLLDWTRSPYIAAFFAFRNSVPKDGYVSIYIYQEYTGGGKSFSDKAPHIVTYGPYINSHQRHYLQQSEYSICYYVDSEKQNAFYASHEEFYTNNNEDSDLLWKFNISSSERIKVLKELDKFNLNSFSLFGNEESLMETVSFREYFYRE